MLDKDKKDHRTPKDVDIYAGEQLRSLRISLGMTQKTLASMIGVTFQQIQKYEKGLNRIGASRLFEFCQHMGVKPSFFFQSTLRYENDIDNNSMKMSEPDYKYEGLTSEEVALISMYHNIADPRNKKLVMELMRSFVVLQS